MKYISGPYTQGQLLKDVHEIEIALTERFRISGVITDAAEQRSWRERLQDNSLGRNTVLFDDQGNPSVMVAFPLQTEADLLTGGRNMPHPAFIVSGVTKPQLYISKYLCITTGAGATLRAISLKNQDPGNAIIFDNALLACKQKGTGWHLLTNAEWAALALWCKKQAFWPRGNNSYGKDVGITSEKGIPSYYYDSSGTKYIGRTMTGSGPLPWSHDGSPFGIFDLNGNIWEWVGGMRLNVGEIQVLQDNNAADNTKDQSSTSVLWNAIDQNGNYVATVWQASTAYVLNAYLTPGNGYVYQATTAGTSSTVAPTWPTTVDSTVADGTVVWTCVNNPTLKYDFVSTPANGGAARINITTQANPSEYYSYNTFETLATTAGVTIPNLLKLLGLAPVDASHGTDGLWMRNVGERLPFRGGGWDIGFDAGVFALYLGYPRSASFRDIGFRAAFVI